MTTVTAPSPSIAAARFNVLTAEQVAFYQERGYLHIPGMFTAAETQELSDHLDWLIDVWAM